MKVIGLTGNIGCGKSSVAAMLREMGAATIDADALARQIRQNDADARRSIERRFGTIDARRLGEIVFADEAALRDLEAILHPLVRDAVRERLAELEEGGVETAVVEVIKLFESPLHDACDESWTVICDEEEAVRRLASSRGMDEAAVRRRLAAQSSQDEKVAMADVVIDNRGTLDETRRQVGAALATLLERPEV